MQQAFTKRDIPQLFVIFTTILYNVNPPSPPYQFLIVFCYMSFSPCVGCCSILLSIFFFVSFFLLPSMELHKANLEAAQPMVPNPNLAMNPFLTQIHPCFYPNQMPYGALMAGQQLQQQQQQQQQQAAAQQQLVVPVSAGGPIPAPVATLASSMFPQQAVVSQQQLVNSLVSRTNSSMINTMPGNSCYTYANGTNGTGNNAMNVNNLAAALPLAYFLSKPSAVAAAICSQAGGQTCSSSCTGTTTTVSSASPYLVSNGGIMSAQQQQQAAAAMLGLQSLAAVHQQGSTHTPSSASNSYHVTPKLKSPAGLLTVSSGRDKFSPY